jgi:hypothetical protein
MRAICGSSLNQFCTQGKTGAIGNSGGQWATGKRFFSYRDDFCSLQLGNIPQNYANHIFKSRLTISLKMASFYNIR